MEKELIYLASPYSHKSESIMEKRFHEVNKCAGAFLEQGYKIFSPISHFHPIAKAHGLPTGWEFWKGIDEVYIGLSKELWVFTQDGWKSSTGVNEEIAIARSFKIKVWLVDPVGYQITHLYHDPDYPKYYYSIQMIVDPPYISCPVSEEDGFEPDYPAVIATKAAEKNIENISKIAEKYFPEMGIKIKLAYFWPDGSLYYYAETDKPLSIEDINEPLASHVDTIIKIKGSDASYKSLSKTVAEYMEQD